jgi:hypothetical protein
LNSAFSRVELEEEVEFRFEGERIDGGVEVCDTGVVDPEVIDVLVFRWFWVAGREFKVAVMLSISTIAQTD